MNEVDMCQVNAVSVHLWSFLKVYKKICENLLGNYRPVIKALPDFQIINEKQHPLIKKKKKKEGLIRMIMYYRGEPVAPSSGQGTHAILVLLTFQRFCMRLL